MLILLQWIVIAIMILYAAVVNHQRYHQLHQHVIMAVHPSPLSSIPNDRIQLLSAGDDISDDNLSAVATGMSMVRYPLLHFAQRLGTVPITRQSLALYRLYSHVDYRHDQTNALYSSFSVTDRQPMIFTSYRYRLQRELLLAQGITNTNRPDHDTDASEYIAAKLEYEQSQTFATRLSQIMGISRDDFIISVRASLPFESKNHYYISPAISSDNMNEVMVRLVLDERFLIRGIYPVDHNRVIITYRLNSYRGDDGILC
jgi:hypothetical protein